MASVTINGTVYGSGGRPGPVDVQVEIVGIGVTHVAADGTRTRMHASHKRIFTLPFQKVSATIRTELETIALLTTTFIFIDVGGASYTVQCEDDPSKRNIGLIAAGPTLYYNVDLKLYEV